MFLLSGVMKTKNTIQNPDVNLPKKGEAAPLLESMWKCKQIVAKCFLLLKNIVTFRGYSKNSKCLACSSCQTKRR